MAEAQIATLEGPLEGTRSCVAVRKNKAGACQCVRYGPRGSSPYTFKELCRRAGLPISIGGSCVEVRKNESGACECVRYGPRDSSQYTFKELCRRAGLPIIIGGRRLSGMEENMAQALPPPMDFPPIEDYDDDLGFFEQLIDPEMLKESVVNAGGGAIGGVVYQQLIGIEVKDKDTGAERPWLDKPWKRMLTAGLLGFGGGRALWNQQRDLAKGHLGAMGSVLATELVAWAMSGKKEGNGNGAEGLGRPRLRSGSHRAQLRGGGFNQLREVDVEDEPVFEDPEVEDEVSLGDIAAWIGG